jgi:dolichol-phosphate mannosyltransferase
LRGMDLDSVQSDGYPFHVELTARALDAGFKVVEIPITSRNRARAKSKIKAAVAVEAAGVLPTLRKYVK